MVVKVSSFFYWITIYDRWRVPDIVMIEEELKNETTLAHMPDDMLSMFPDQEIR
jgi:hypothetical protein